MSRDRFFNINSASGAVACTAVGALWGVLQTLLTLSEGSDASFILKAGAAAGGVTGLFFWMRELSSPEPSFCPS